MKSKSLMFWLALLFVFAGAMMVWAAYRRKATTGSQSVATTRLSEKVRMKDLVLIERSGKKFEMSRLDGKVWVASFFFTSCPQECWRQNLQIKDLADLYGPQGVTFVSITCDPERDTPVKLAEYADRLGADEEHWLFLTGALEHVQRLGQDKFKVSVTPTTHSKKLILIKPSGEALGYFGWSDSGEMKRLREEMDKMLTDDRLEVSDVLDTTNSERDSHRAAS